MRDINDPTRTSIRSKPVLNIFILSCFMAMAYAQASPQYAHDAQIQAAAKIYSLSSLIMLAAVGLLLLAAAVLYYQGRKQADTERRKSMIWVVSLLSGAILALMFLIIMPFAIGAIYPGFTYYL
jgi:uncharacterized membrane-anchored protein